MKILQFFLIFFLVFANCSKNEVQENQSNTENSTWLIPKDDVTGNFDDKDRIVSIDLPNFVKVKEAKFIFDHDLVFAINEKGIIKIYPEKILATHEIVNDSIQEKYFAVTYCPLTKSALCFDRLFNGEILEFGVSGMLYNDNLIPYDRNTESIWSQMLGFCINGKYAGTRIQPILMVSLNWKTVKKLYPDALVLQHNTCSEICILKNEGGDNRDNIDGYTAGEEFMGIINRNKVELFNYQSLNQELSFNLNKKQVVGSQELNFISNFQLENDKNYTLLKYELPFILMDNEGVKWDIFGYSSNSNKRLRPYYSYKAALWAWEAFYKVTEVYNF